MRNESGITLNGIYYKLVPDTKEQKKILEETINGENCHNYCALAHMCKQLVSDCGGILCRDVFLKDNVHFEFSSVCV